MAAKTYLFLPEGKMMKQGYVLKDDAGNAVCEAKVLKQPLFGAAVIEFVNHLTGKSEEHKVGHTVTTETSGGMGEVLSTKSRFKFDGENIWDFLHGKGIRIDSNFSGNKLGMTYTVTLKGQPFATLASTTPGGKSLLTSSHCYDVTAEEDDLDLAFVVAFAIARTDQTFYS